MVFVFISIFILLAILLVVLSTVSIKIEKLNLSNYNSKNKLEYDYIIFIQLHFIGKIKILSIKIDKEKLRKLDIKQKIEKIDIDTIKKDLQLKEKSKEIFKKLKIEIPKFDLRINLGTEDVIITSAVITILSTIVSVGLATIIKQYDEEKYRYAIYPIYQNKNIIKLDLSCIIKVKMVHIIYIIYVLLKKRRVEKHERTSNRRTYDYSYE